jgi:hypothetical protein
MKHDRGICEDGSIHEDYFICWICSSVLHDNNMVNSTSYSQEFKCKECEREQQRGE